MKYRWQDLPVEVWLNVFNYVPYFWELVQCRLVCKAWDPLAERALFSRDFKFSQTSTMQKLYNHLSKKPALGKTIRSVELFYSLVDLDLLKKLLYLTMAPNIEHVHGESLRPDLYTILLDVIQTSQVEYKALKSIPDPFEFNKTYVDACYALKNTLESIEIEYGIYNVLPMDFLYDHLYEFKRLRLIKLRKTNFGSLIDLNGVLDGLHHLDDISLSFGFAGNSLVIKNKSDMNIWLTRRVTKVERLKKLTMIRITGNVPADNLVEYATYKYPNLGSFTISGLEVFENLEQILTFIKHIPIVTLRNMLCKDPQTLGTLIRTMKSTNNIINIGYEIASLEPRGRVDKNAVTDTTNFLLRLEGHVPHLAHKEILSNIGSSYISSLVVNLFTNKDWHASHDPSTLLSFYDIIRMVPQVQKIDFADNYIPHQRIEPDELILEKLQALKFYSAEIEAGILPTISNIAPNLEHLELDSCIVLEEDKSFQKTTRIKMPYTSFSTLSLSTEEIFWVTDMQGDPFYAYYVSIANKLDIINVIFVRLVSSCTENPEQHFVLINKEPPTLISREEFMACSDGRPVIDIECKSLSLLKIEIDPFYVEMNFIDGKLENGKKSALKEFEENYAKLKTKFISLTDASKFESFRSNEEGKTLEMISSEMENWRVELEKEHLKLKEYFIAILEHNLPEKRSEQEETTEEEEEFDGVYEFY